MARTAATIQAEIDSLKAARASGVLRVRHGETETTYQSSESMGRVIADLEAELAALGTSRVRAVRFTSRKGFDS